MKTEGFYFQEQMLVEFRNFHEEDDNLWFKTDVANDYFYPKSALHSNYIQVSCPPPHDWLPWSSTSGLMPDKRVGRQ